MKYRKKHKKRNPVAKNTFTFNKPKIERDRTKYTRKLKHRYDERD